MTGLASIKSGARCNAKCRPRLCLLEGHFLSLPHRTSNDRFTSVKRPSLDGSIEASRNACRASARSPRCAVTLTRTHRAAPDDINREGIGDRHFPETVEGRVRFEKGGGCKRLMRIGCLNRTRSHAQNFFAYIEFLKIKKSKRGLCHAEEKDLEPDAHASRSFPSLYFGGLI